MMNKLCVLMWLLVVSCGTEPASFQVAQNTTAVDEPIPKDMAQSMCSVEQLDDGALITCPDGSEAMVYNGHDGEAGVDGIDGVDGEDGVDGNNGSDGTNGTAGVDGNDGLAGQDGQDGEDGVDGSNGVDGTSCTVLAHPLGAQIVCTDGTSVILSTKKGK